MKHRANAPWSIYRPHPKEIKKALKDILGVCYNCVFLRIKISLDGQLDTSISCGYQSDADLQIQSCPKRIAREMPPLSHKQAWVTHKTKLPFLCKQCDHNKKDDNGLYYCKHALTIDRYIPFLQKTDAPYWCPILDEVNFDLVRE